MGNRGYSGTIRWMGSTAIGPCSKCGANSGFNADLTKNIFARSGWTEIKNWRTNANTELYESNGEFNNAQGLSHPRRPATTFATLTLHWTVFRGLVTHA